MINSLSLKIVGSLLIAGCMLVSAASAGQVYKWVDKDGRVHFGDTPPQEQLQSVTEIEIRTLDNTAEATQWNDNQAGPGTARKVVMYGTSWCGYCKKAKRYFAKNNIPFREYDIEKSAVARQRYDRLNGKGVPLIVVGDKLLSGFSAASFERLYN